MSSTSKNDNEASLYIHIFMKVIQSISLLYKEASQKVSLIFAVLLVTSRILALRYTVKLQ